MIQIEKTRAYVAASVANRCLQRLGPSGFVRRFLNFTIAMIETVDSKQAQSQPVGPSDLRRRKRMRFLAVCLALLVSLAVTEGVLQILEFPEQVIVGWRSTHEADQLNQFGFRGQHIEYQEDDFVVLLIGDSQAEGWGLEPPQTPERRLEHHLKQNGVSRAKVFTLGAAGYGQDQQLLALREYYAKGMRADAVLIWEVPYNDVFNNMFVSPPKPSFALKDGQLIEPRISEIGSKLRSSIKIVALIQNLIDPEMELAISDDAWSKRYLPEPYKPVISGKQPVMIWQEAADTRFGGMPYQEMDTEKSSFAIGFTPPSARMTYALDLTAALLGKIELEAVAHGDTFLAFDVQTPSSRLWGQPLHMEPLVYEFKQKRYRFSFSQEYQNIQQMNRGIRHQVLACDLEDWRLSKQDWHLNSQAVDHVMKKLAAEISAQAKSAGPPKKAPEK
jgi:hypothetical protein